MRVLYGATVVEYVGQFSGWKGHHCARGSLENTVDLSKKQNSHFSKGLMGTWPCQGPARTASNAQHSDATACLGRK